MREIVELTKDLIRFKTMTSNTAQIHRCADFIEEWLKRQDLPARRFNFNDTPSILSAPGDGPVDILLMSHIDVVDGPDDLFEPYEKGGKLYGRGAIDDKYAAALSMILMREHTRRGAENPSLGILITGDEEVGGVNGAKKVLEQIKAGFCIALDGGDIGKIVVKEKGILRLRLTASGQSAHGARPWLGENAIENLMADCAEIRSFFEGLDAPGHWHRTVNLGKIEGGKSVNQVPDRAEAIFDIRYTEDDDVDALVEEMRSRIKGTLTVTDKEPLFIGGDHPYLDLLLSVSEGTETGFEHGASDARHLADFGIKSVIWGADGEMSQHTESEHAVIDSLFDLYDRLDRFLIEAGKGA
jgi:succinyl-diaminopimelate desuccinylase